MARRNVMAALALSALAAAPTPAEAKTPAVETSPAASGPPPEALPDPRVVDLEARVADAEKALTAAHESYEKQLADAATENTALRARVEELELTIAMERDGAQKRLADLRAEFDAAWERRERSLGGDKPSPSAPVRGRVQRFAAALIHCHNGAGAKLAIVAGDPIPDDAVLDGVHPSAIEER